MFSRLADLTVWLTYPPNASLLLAAVGGIAILLRWPRLGVALGALALGWSVLWSIPQCSDWLRGTLERRHPVVEEERLPHADAIVVLGGGSRMPWLRRNGGGPVDPEELTSSRLAAGARAWLAGKAPVIVLSGGRAGRGASEADRMAAAIARLGVPASALLLEEQSSNTRGNALFTKRLGREHGIHTVLLVTSAVHMPRARLQFAQAGIEAIPVPVPERAHRDGWRSRWLPSRSALWRSGRALKEYAGLLALRIG